MLLSFPAGTLSQQVTVEVIGDTTREANNEYFNFNLTGASGGPTVADAQARVTILDDDHLATDRRLSIAPKVASVTEPESGDIPTTFTVTLIPASGTTPTPSGKQITVSIAASGTAIAPDDYTGIPVPPTLTFAPGTTTQTVTTAVQADAVLENPEAAILTLANPTNATVAATSSTTSGSATLHIYDAVSRAALDFYTVDPCRAVDTRDAAKGGPAPVAAGRQRSRRWPPPGVRVPGAPTPLRSVPAPPCTAAAPTSLRTRSTPPALGPGISSTPPPAGPGFRAGSG